ncbi:MAG: DUF4189 domain-containing protein [Candidatus Nanopelagicales bacterium]|nr:DUF4189 domain-containing protein [Candidatus Nanopelagicales bacterium]MDZ4250039.1 DUF4189 domain-containing protein [Candidatus Nanopelagicales bacterium]MDZ7576585.1 DUF4189 domain-containing protein [Candidatus Nanopelagicales bacterium]
MSVFRTRLVILLASLAVLGSALVAGTSAGAASPPTTAQQPDRSVSTYRNNFGAISLAFKGGAVGWSYDYSTRKKAVKRAHRQCRSRSSTKCTKIAWVRNGCLAVAVRWSGSNVTYYGWAVRGSKKKAYRAAKRECGGKCVRRAFTCTTR